ncbi:SIR2 family protein [Sphingomonas oligophenolica]
MVAGNAAVFAGAGLSVPAGFVDWKELLRPLADELDLDIDRESDLVSVAQFHVNASGNNRHRLHRAVIEALSADNPPTLNHRLLARLPIAIWWTTNYDKLIEKALRENGKVVDVKTAVVQLADTRPRRDAIVYKMHGDVDRPNEAIVTRDDFECYPKKGAAFLNALAGDLVSRTFLFVGFSFTDPNLDYVLSRVRQMFAENQRRHFAIFRRRARLPDEDDDSFAYARVRQELVLRDLQRFNVKAVLIDDYSEITDLLSELERRYRRQTLFVSSSAADFGPWGEEAVQNFMRALGAALVHEGIKVATGLGRGVGNALFTGAAEEAMRAGTHLEDSLIVRPFPRAIADAAERDRLWDQYRHDIIGRAGTALFLFGNQRDGKNIVESAGIRREFEIAREHALVVLPIGATGAMARTLWQEVEGNPDLFMPELDAEGRALLKKLGTPTGDLMTLVEPVVALTKRLAAKLPGR